MNLENTLLIDKEDIVSIRNMETNHGHVPITQRQRLALWALLKFGCNEYSYLHINGLGNGFQNDTTATTYCTIPSLCQRIANVSPGDILEFHDLYAGLEGMVLGIDRDTHQHVAILNLNYNVVSYLLEHYNQDQILRDRHLKYRFISCGLQAPEVQEYYETLLRPMLMECGEKLFPDPIIELLALYTAEMTQLQDLNISVNQGATEEADTSPTTPENSVQQRSSSGSRLRSCVLS